MLIIRYRGTNLVIMEYNLRFQLVEIMILPKSILTILSQKPERRLLNHLLIIRTHSQYIIKLVLFLQLLLLRCM